MHLAEQRVSSQRENENDEALHMEEVPKQAGKMDENTLARFLAVPLLYKVYRSIDTPKVADDPRTPFGLPPHVRDAWRRCAQEYRLPIDVSLTRALENGMQQSAGTNESVAHQLAPRLFSRRAETLLIGTAEMAAAALQNSGILMMLANADGLIFHSIRLGLPSYWEMDAITAPGANWAERVIGNNGLGTAAFLRQPVAFQGEEHFCSDLRKFATAGCPIFGCDGRIIAILAAIFDRSEAGNLLLGLLQLGGKLMQARLLDVLMEEESSGAWLISLRPDEKARDSFLFPFRGLLSTDQIGWVRGVNEAALGLLGLQRIEEAIGQRLENLVGIGLYQLIGQSNSATGPISLCAPNGQNLHIEIKPGRSRVAEEGTSAPTRPPSPQRRSGADRVTAKLLPKLIALQARKIPILVTGESGVGKNRLVQRLHAEGPRKNGPLVTVNCAAIPRELIQAELFGYEPGSFTGAHSKGRTGKVQAADKGILFLNEIGDMPLDLQTSLLQLLDTSEATPIGRASPVPVDIHVVATTNRSLKDEVRAGRFRLDLYYRLAGAEIELPPLRKREDKACIISAIFETEVAQLGSAQERALSDEVWDIFLRHPWPGNLRQLQHTIRLLLSGTTRPVIEISDLPQQFLNEFDAPAEAHAGASASTAAAARPAKDNRSAPLCQWELQALRAALDQAQGNISEAARQLGITRTTLYRKMGRYGLKAR